MTTIMNSGNFDTLYLFKEHLMQAKERNANVEVYPIHLAFENLEDPEEQQFFQNVSTALALPEETVDKLIEGFFRRQLLLVDLIQTDQQL